MTRRLTVVVACGLVLGCGRGCNRGEAPRFDQQQGASTPIAQPGAGAEDQKRLEFSIDAVFERHQPSEQPPFHVAGGDWTFFDAHTSDGSRFGFGVQGKATDDVAFGKGMWIVPDRAAGARLLQTFAKAFGGQLPPDEADVPLAPKPLGLALLGNLSRRDESGFSGQGGWQPTKLFLQAPGIEAEVFFNFNLAEKRGEFSEKDSEYADDMLRFMARELRDGPPPQPTPENDARISREGPKLEAFRALGPVGATFHRFDATGEYLFYSVTTAGRSTVYQAKSAGSAPDVELFRAEQEVRDIECDARGEKCVVEQVVRKQANVYSSDDPKSYWLFRFEKRELVRLQGAWNDKAMASISPDGHWLALTSYQQRSGGPGKYQVIHFLSTSALGRPKTQRSDEEWLDVIGWRGSGASTTAVIQLGLGFGASEQSHGLVELGRDQLTRLSSAPPEASAGKVSPDGKHEYSCQGDATIVITELATKHARSFAVAPRERHALSEGCDLSWRGPHYLEFSPERTGFIDVRSLKLSFLTPPDQAEPEALDYAPNFEFALDTTDKQLRIARILVP